MRIFALFKQTSKTPFWTDIQESDRYEIGVFM
jgi:hypothetical protein